MVNISTRIIKLLSSTKLTILLFIFLLPLLIIGGTFPQHYPAAYYYKYGLPGHIFLLLGLNSVFQSPIFTILLLLFLLNILACLYVRIPKKFKSSRHIPLLPLDHIKNMKFHTTSTKTYTEIENYLKKRGYKLKNKNRNCSVFTKGEIGWWGAEIAHLGLLTIIIAGIISSTLSKEYFFQLTPGESAQFSNYTVQLKTFKIPLYPDGTPRQYISTILLAGRNTKSFTAIISVNHPLNYKGYLIYQSSYGIAPFKIGKAEILVTNSYGRKTTLQVPFARPVTFTLPISNSKVTIFCPVFIPDFVYDIAAKKIYSRSMEHKNPALMCKISYNKKLTTGWLFLNYPQFNTISFKKIRFSLEAYKPIYYSGIEINYDPGTKPFIIGSIIFLMGIFLSFYIPFQRIWICQKDRDTILIGGISYRGDKVLIKDLSQLSGGKIEVE